MRNTCGSLGAVFICNINTVASADQMRDLELPSPLNCAFYIPNKIKYLFTLKINEEQMW